MSMSCSTAITVRPCACHDSITDSSTRVVAASTAVNGSSSRINAASCRIVRANSTRWNCPADSAWICRLPMSASPTRSSAARAAAIRATLTARNGPSRCAASATTSRQVIGNERSRWLPWANSAISRASSPPRSMRPAASGCRPARARSSVVFPAPFGPINAVRLPGAKRAGDAGHDHARRHAAVRPDPALPRGPAS